MFGNPVPRARVARAFSLLLATLLLGCGTGSQSSPGIRAVPTPETPDATLMLVARAEPPSVAGTPLVSEPINYFDERRFFNAGLALYDGQLRAHPYLAEGLPRLNSEEWKVFPDGTMETTYRLRPGLRWHDGTPLTASDFVFARQVYLSPEYSTYRMAPHTLMADVVAPDDRTVVIRWSAPFPGAGALQGITGSSQNPYSPLPRHILETAFTASPQGMLTLPFWTGEYVGLGPYRVDRWEPGSYLQATAFDGHALGKPAIQRLQVAWVGDANSALAQLLAGYSAMPINNSIGIDQGVVLKERWEGSRAGTVTFQPDNGRYQRFQFRPDVVRPQALLDLRVRQAIASTVDKQAANEALYHGSATITDTWIFPTAPYYARIQREVPTYPLDPQRGAQLMAAAGFTKNAAGVYMGPEGPLNLETKNVASAQNNAERSILSDGWRRFGFEVEEAAATPDESRNNQVLSTFRSLWATGGGNGEFALDSLVSNQIPSADNRWIGQNRGGWASPEYDRIVAGLAATIDPSERETQIIRAARLINDELAALPLYYSAHVVAYPSALNLNGPNERVPTGVLSWNIHHWEYRP
jgi:peptide/nickel transport system substrate-binding protein